MSLQVSQKAFSTTFFSSRIKAKVNRNDPLVISTFQQDQIVSILAREPNARSKSSLAQLSLIVERHPVLGGVKTLGDEAWERLLRVLSTCTIPRGDNVVENSDFSRLAPFACIVKGESVECDEAGNEVGVLTPGRFLLARQGVVSVKATSQITLMRMDILDYEAFLNIYPDANIGAKSRILLSLPYFCHWGLSTVRTLAYLFRTLAYEPGEVIYSALEAVDRLYVIADGYASRCVIKISEREWANKNYNPSQNPKSIEILGQGDVFGLPMCLNRSISDHRIEAHMTRCVVMVLDRRGLDLFDIPTVEKLNRAFPKPSAVSIGAVKKTARSPMRSNSVEPFSEHLHDPSFHEYDRRSKSTSPTFHASTDHVQFDLHNSGSTMDGDSLIATREAQMHELRGSNLQTKMANISFAGGSGLVCVPRCRKDLVRFANVIRRPISHGGHPIPDNDGTQPDVRRSHEESDKGQTEPEDAEFDLFAPPPPSPKMPWTLQYHELQGYAKYQAQAAKMLRKRAASRKAQVGYPHGIGSLPTTPLARMRSLDLVFQEDEIRFTDQGVTKHVGGTQLRPLAERDPKAISEHEGKRKGRPWRRSHGNKSKTGPEARLPLLSKSIHF